MKIYVILQKLKENNKKNNVILCIYIVYHDYISIKIINIKI